MPWHNNTILGKGTQILDEAKQGVTQHEQALRSAKTTIVLDEKVGNTPSNGPNSIHLAKISEPVEVREFTMIVSLDKYI